MAPAVLATPRSPAHKELLMDTRSVAYVLCRIEEDSSLTPVGQHGDFLTGIAAGGYAVEVEDLEFAYALYAGEPLNGSATRVASFREGRIGYRLWASPCKASPLSSLPMLASSLSSTRNRRGVR